MVRSVAYSQFFTVYLPKPSVARSRLPRSIGRSKTGRLESARRGYTGFHDEAYLGGYDVRHSLFDVGAHVGSASVGAGAGVEIDDATAFADVPGYVNPLVLVTVDVKYEVERIERFGVVVEGSVSYATTLQTSTDVSMYGDAFCARLAIGLSL